MPNDTRAIAAQHANAAAKLLLYDHYGGRRRAEPPPPQDVARAQAHALVAIAQILTAPKGGADGA